MGPARHPLPVNRRRPGTPAGIDLIETSGHVPGHQAILVHLPESGPVLLAIDAVTMQAHFNPDAPSAPWTSTEPAPLPAPINSWTWSRRNTSLSSSSATTVHNGPPSNNSLIITNKGRNPITAFACAEKNGWL
nr:hypothetical protein [Dictyobacter vulcani]